MQVTIYGNKMKISAIIPTLGKRPEMLEEAVNSIKLQTIPVHEIIVVNDNDETYGNQARKINKGVLQSTGDAYFFMGDDDILLPNFAEVLSNEMLKGNWDIVTSRFRVFGNEEGEHGPAGFPLCSTLVKRSMYDKTKGYDGNIPIGIDADFYFQCFEKNTRWTILGDVLYMSRVHKDQYSLTGDWSGYKPLIMAKYGGKYSHL